MTGPPSMAGKLSEAEALVERLKQELLSKQNAMDELVQDSLGDLTAFREIIQERNSLRAEVDHLKGKMTQLENLLKQAMTSQPGQDQSTSPPLEAAHLFELSRCSCCNVHESISAPAHPVNLVFVGICIAVSTLHMVYLISN